MIGIRPAQGAADRSMLSAMRLVAERQGERVRKNKAETMVPPLASAIHQTYSASANPQATGMLTPQVPMPLMNSQAIWMTSSVNSMNDAPNPTHHQRGARWINTRLLTSSLTEVSVTSGATTGATGGSSAGSVIAISQSRLTFRRS